MGGPADGSDGGLGKDKRSRRANGKRDPPLPPGTFPFERHDPTQPKFGMDDGHADAEVIGISLAWGARAERHRRAGGQVGGGHQPE